MSSFQLGPEWKPNDDRIYTEEQVAWLKACDEYRVKKDLKFLKATDYLEIAKLIFQRPALAGILEGK